eukprot:gene5280-3785_t
MASAAGNQRVTVAVRIRPIVREGANMHAQEKFELPAAQRIGDTALRVELTRPGEPVKSSTFNFDYIFDQESTQLEVYEDCVVDMVDATLAGVNASLLAYGQTGSGKTFSVLGDVKPNPLENDLLTVNSGIFLRVLNDLMEYKLRRANQGWHVVIGLSCVEIYNENIRDLFGGNPNSPPPPIKAVMVGEDVILPNLITKEMTTLQAVFTEIQLAIARRASRATEANAASSRSHCLFFIDVLQQASTAPAPSLELIDPRKSNEKGGGGTAKRSMGSPVMSSNTPQYPAHEMPFQGTILHIPGQKEPVYTSKIILADLAGSERIARSGVSGAGLTEATSINSSLTALGNVVHSLHEGGYVSYRTSNLTRLLKPTFSHPSSRVLLLAQCAPTQLTFEETVSTLHFANKVKAMKVTTVTGTAAEKLQFDYLEVAKTCDAIGADLRIFALECEARPNTIRRTNPKHKGVFYDCLKGGAKERLAEMESNGTLKAVRHERDETAKRKAQEQAKFEANLRNEVELAKKKLVAEHKERMSDIQGEIGEEKHLRVNHSMEMLIRESSATKMSMELQESVARSKLMKVFYTTHKTVCTKEIERNAQRLQETSKSLVQTQAESTSPAVDCARLEIDKTYALAAWYHCTSKRFFASTIQQREYQMTWLKAVLGNKKLEYWQQKLWSLHSVNLERPFLPLSPPSPFLLRMNHLKSQRPTQAFQLYTNFEARDASLAGMNTALEYAISNLTDRGLAISTSLARKKTATRTLVVDCISLYQECLLYFWSTKNTTHNTVLSVIKTFFQKLAESVVKQNRIEFLFAAIPCVSVAETSLNDPSNDRWSENSKLLDLNNISSDGASDLAICAWGAMRDLAVNYTHSGSCVFLSTEDAFTAMMDHAKRDADDCSKRMLCSRDPRCLFAMKTHEVLPNLFDFIMLQPEKPEKQLEPCTWSGNESASFLTELYAISRALDRVALAEDKGNILDAVQNFLKLKDDDWPRKINDWLHTCNLSWKESLLLRARGELGLTSIKVPKRSLVFEHPNVGTFRMCNETKMGLVFSLSISETECFSLALPIRRAFEKYIGCPTKVFSERENFLDVLVMNARDDSGLTESSVLEEKEWHEIENNSNSKMKPVAVAIKMLHHGKILNNDEVEQRLLKWIEMYPRAGKETGAKSEDDQMWLEFQCALLHVFLASEVCDVSALQTFHLLGMYQTTSPLDEL